MEYKIGTHVFNDWQIVREIGSGASGRVWEIEKVDHDIAISSALKVIQVPQNPSLKKTLYNDGMDEVSVTHFFQGVVNDLTEEIKIMIGMKGFPYIVNCEDYSVIKYPDEVKWDILIRMELLTPIQTYIQKNVLTEADVIKLGKELLQTLQLFESKGIIHRDIKPDNIFVDNYGNFKIGDFGIARICDKASADLSKKGTENYMAPEVFHGKEYDHTVDIYSLGLVLYKFLNNNRLPFYPESGAYSDWDMQQALIDRLGGKKEMPMPVSASPELGKIILRMCAHSPEERYQRAEDVLADLEHITGSAKGIVGLAADTSGDVSGGTGASAEFNATRAMFAGGMVIHDAGAVKKRSRTGITGNSSPRTSPSSGVNPDSVKGESGAGDPQAGAQKSGSAKPQRSGGGNEAWQAGTTDSAKSEQKKEKKTIKKKTIIQGITAAAILLAVLFYFLMNKTYSLTVTDGSGTGTYKGGQKVTAAAKEVPGSTFTKWEITGKLSLTDKERTEKTVSFKMPRHDVSMKAVYLVNTHKAVVNGGTGTGEYDVGEEVTVTAEDPEVGKEFAGWDVEDGSVSLEHADKQKTSFVMPDDDIEISATYKNLQYSMQVEDGDGSGSYDYGETVRLTAKEKSGKSFTEWAVLEGDLELTDEEKTIPELMIEMPACDVMIQAKYETNQHEVVVGAGSGSGTYNVGDKVTITAQAAETGKEFAGWEIEEGGVSLQNSRKEKTNFEMPDEKVVVNAVYQDIDYALTVNDGNGSGAYHYGDQVQISAKDSSSGLPFSYWTIDKGTVEISDLKVANITFTMPAEEVAVTAHYAQAKYTVKVENGRGSGMYEAGSTVTVSAAPTDASGVPFARWEVTAGTLQLEDAAKNEVSFQMPSEKIELRAVYEAGVPDGAGGAYSVVVFGGSGAGVYAEGDTVTVTAEDEPGKKFSCWFISAEGSETVENDNASFTFEMPATDLIITAVYDMT